MIEAIIFDVDGTLYNETDAKVKAELLTAQFISEQSKYSMEEVYFAYRQSKAEVINGFTGYSIRNDREKWYHNTLKKLVISNVTAEQASDFYWRVVLDNMEPYPDLNLVIETLAKKYKLYVLTDELFDIQIKKLNRLGLTDYFSEIVSSEIIGKTKPNVQLFDYIIKLIDKSVRNIAMVGDNPIADVKGANLAGIHSVWLKRGKYHYYSYSEDQKPEITIDNYLQLPELLERIK